MTLLRSRLGAWIQAIRDDEGAAASLGVRVLAGKRIIFLLAAVGCAAAGVLWLATSVSFQPKTFFGIQWTAYMIFMALAGGLGTFEGPILGAILFFFIQNQFGEIGVWYLVGLGVTAVLFALFLPRGIWSLVEDRIGLRLIPVGYRVRTAVPIPERTRIPTRVAQAAVQPAVVVEPDTYAKQLPSARVWRWAGSISIEWSFVIRRQRPPA